MSEGTAARSLGGHRCAVCPPSPRPRPPPSAAESGDQRNQKDKERKEEKGSKHFPLYCELLVDGLPTAAQQPASQPEFMTRAKAYVALEEFCAVSSSHAARRSSIPLLKHTRHRIASPFYFSRERLFSHDY